jgi:hypothetical protein
MTSVGRAAAAACVGVLVSLLVAVPAVAAGPKPDPPPIKHAPPPPQPPAPQPPPPPVQPAPPPPAAVVPVAPVPRVVQPTAAKRKVRRARHHKRRVRHRPVVGQVTIREQPPALVAGAGGSGSNLALPFLLAAFTAAMVMLLLALTPARAVPWSRASHALEDHRDELGVIGALSLVATMVFFLLVQVTK